MDHVNDDRLGFCRDGEGRWGIAQALPLVEVGLGLDPPAVILAISASVNARTLSSSLTSSSPLVEDPSEAEALDDNTPPLLPNDTGKAACCASISRWDMAEGDDFCMAEKSSGRWEASLALRLATRRR